MQNKQEGPVKSVNKAFELLSTIVFSETGESGVALGELSAKLDIPKNTAHNLLKSMIACGYIQQTEKGFYAPGVVCRRIGIQNRLQAPWVKTLMVPELEKVARRLESDVVFVALAGGYRVDVASANGEQVLKIDISQVPDRSIYSFPTGRVLVAYASESELDDIVNVYGFPGEEWGGIDSVDELKKEAAKIRRAGCISMDKVKKQVVSFGVPLICKGKFMGALGTYLPAFLCAGKRRSEILEELKRLAKTLSGKLEYDSVWR